jgi:hypothetical protein
MISIKHPKLRPISMIENVNKLISNLTRVGVIAAIGLSLYVIYNNYESFSLKKNIVEIKPQTTNRIIVTAAE